MNHSRKVSVLVVAGEASGDSHAAALVRAMRDAEPGSDFTFFGATGPALRAEGVETVVSADEFAIIGLPEVLRALPMFWEAFRRLKRAARERRPDVAVLVDFPEFNLKLATALKRLGVKVVYYISPQLWAWRSYRSRTIRLDVDRLLSILPFEPRWYADRGIRNVEFVGNPTVAELALPIPKESFCGEVGLSADRPLVALLPGSRAKEVVRILPTLLESAMRLGQSDPGIQFVVAMSPHRTEEDVDESFRRAGLARDCFGGRLAVVFGRTVDAVGAADAAAVASGTATLETAVIGTPLAVVYRSTLLNYLLLKPLVKVDHIGLVNLIAGKRLAKEFLQGEFTPKAVADEITRLLGKEVNAGFRRELRNVTEGLRGHSASATAAKSVLEVLGR